MAAHRWGSEPPTTTDSTKEREFQFLDAALFNVDQHYLTWITANRSKRSGTGNLHSDSWLVF
jgi:hypothetical protein